MKLNELIDCAEFVKQAEKNKTYKVIFEEVPTYASFLLQNGGHYLIYEDVMLCGGCVDLSGEWETWEELGIISELSYAVETQDIGGIKFDYFAQEVPIFNLSLDTQEKVAEKIKEWDAVEIGDDGAYVDYCGLHVEYDESGLVQDLDLMARENFESPEFIEEGKEYDVKVVTDGENYAFMINGMITVLNRLENFEDYDVTVLSEE